MVEETDVGENRDSDSPYDPYRDDEEASAKKLHATPKSRRRHQSTIAASQKSAARRGDPNSGRCLLTRGLGAVQACRLLHRAPEYPKLNQLEWVWGMRYCSLNVDTSRNLLFLKADWHIFLDDNDCFMVPDAAIVQGMYDRIRQYKNPKVQPMDIQQLYGGNQVFKYNLVATENLKEEVIVRRRAPDEITATNAVPSIPPFTCHQYPFETLGVLESHVQPHFVLVNAGKKLARTTHLLPLASTFAQTLGTNAQGTNALNALLLLSQILEIYRVWTQVQVPSIFLQHPESSERRPPPEDEQDSDGDTPSEGRGRYSKRSRKSHADGRKSLEGVNPAPKVGYRMLLPITDDLPCLDDDGMSVDSVTSPMEGRQSGNDSCGMLEESLLSWAENCSQVATDEGGWEASVFNDNQIGHYRTERARVPRKESWRTWRAPWIRRNYETDPPQTEKFSSNDWAVYHECRYLTD